MMNFMTSSRTMRDSKISIALCTYNGEKYIAEQLASIINQTRKPDEIIIYDDCSTDSTTIIVNDFIKDGNTLIRLFVNTNQQGVTKNFINAGSTCTGDIIFFCDQDDVWKKNKIQRLCSFFEDDDVTATFCNAEIVDAELNDSYSKQWDKIKYRPKVINNVKVYRQYELIPELLKHNVATGMCFAIRKNIINYQGLPKGCLHDAWLVWIATKAGKVVAIDETLVMYRQHLNNVIGSESKISSERAKQYKLIRLKELESLLQRYIAFKKNLGNKEYVEEIDEDIRFYKNRIRLFHENKTRIIPEVMKLVLNGCYKKYTEDNVISAIKDIYAAIK